MADWSILPSDILCEIALKLDAVEDLVDFSAVCSSWYCVYTMIKKKWTAKMPWLMLAENTEEEDNPNYIRKTFCHMRERCYSLSLPQSFGARCWGSSSGWIVTFDFKLELHMLNPFSGVRIRLPNPPKHAEKPPPDPDIPFTDEEIKARLENERLLGAEKVIVLGGDDEYDDDCVVVVIYDLKMCRVAYTRPKYDQSWTFVRTPKTCRAYDVVRRGSQILIAYGRGGLGCFDISADEGGQPVTAMEYVPAQSPEFLGSLHESLHGIYLVEAFGDILMLLRYKEIDEGQDDFIPIFEGGVRYQTFYIDTKIWEETKDIGDVALFVGNNCSMAVRASATPNCRRNCIYFNDDASKCWDASRDGVLLVGGHDMGIFRIEDEEIEPHVGEDIHSLFCPPVWFMPKF